MKVQLPATTAAEGIFGPEIVLNTVSGRGCVRRDDGVLVGELPPPPMTNAFLVWLGRPVVVISEGVSLANLPAVAEALRNLLGAAASVPVVASMGRLGGAGGWRAASHNPGSCPDRDLARAEAYVLVQAGWNEGTPMRVELHGGLFSFGVEFREGPAGRYHPVVK